MKKYFVRETDEPVKFGDVINLTFYKDLEDGKVTIEKEVKFSEATLDWLIEMQFVEERDAEDDAPLIDFSDDECDECIHDELLNEICEDQYEQIKKITEFLNEVTEMKESLEKLWKLYNRKNKKPAKLKKK